MITERWFKELLKNPNTASPHNLKSWKEREHWDDKMCKNMDKVVFFFFFPKLCFYILLVTSSNSLKHDDPLAQCFIHLHLSLNKELWNKRKQGVIW